MINIILLLLFTIAKLLLRNELWVPKAAHAKQTLQVKYMIQIHYFYSFIKGLISRKVLRLQAKLSECSEAVG